MKPRSILAAASLTLVIAACVPHPRATPPVQTAPALRPSPAPAPIQAPPLANWQDGPATDGDWSYADGEARFAGGISRSLFTMRCDAQARSVLLTRQGQASAPATMTIRTESQTRTLAANLTSGPQPEVASRIAASDRLLDAMALSKGRFAVEVPGTPTLFLPSWAEVTRVIEDCR